MDNDELIRIVEEETELLREWAERAQELGLPRAEHLAHSMRARALTLRQLTAQARTSLRPVETRSRRPAGSGLQRHREPRPHRPAIGTAPAPHEGSRVTREALARGIRAAAVELQRLEPPPGAAEVEDIRGTVLAHLQRLESADLHPKELDFAVRGLLAVGRSLTGLNPPITTTVRRLESVAERLERGVAGGV